MKKTLLRPRLALPAPRVARRLRRTYTRERARPSRNFIGNKVGMRKRGRLDNIVKSASPCQAGISMRAETLSLSPRERALTVNVAETSHAALSLSQEEEEKQKEMPESR